MTRVFRTDNPRFNRLDASGDVILQDGESLSMMPRGDRADLCRCKDGECRCEPSPAGRMPTGRVDHADAQREDSTSAYARAIDETEAIGRNMWRGDIGETLAEPTHRQDGAPVSATDRYAAAIDESEHEGRSAWRR